MQRLPQPATNDSHHNTVMATPRSQLVDPDYPMHYHLVSRCVRRSWLCGVDRQSGKDYEHRKGWLEERIHDLARYFAVAVDAYAIMSNHFHLVVYFDPQESNRWSDEDKARRHTLFWPYSPCAFSHTTYSIFLALNAALTSTRDQRFTPQYRHGHPKKPTRRS
jgi:hypothetical protein